MKRIIAITGMILLVLCLHAQDSKVSPLVRQAMRAGLSGSPASFAKAIDKNSGVLVSTITAFVRTTDTDILRQHGCRIYAQWDDIVIASIPLDELYALTALPQVKRIEAGRSCSVTNDTTATITRAREIWQLEQANTQSNNKTTSQYITGSGVVIGVMDIGFDFTHPTFYSSDGLTYRIKQFWDQIDQTQGGEAVVGVDTISSPARDTILVGRQYVGQQALLALQHSYDGLCQTHGTHTTGTAAGSGWQGEPQPSSELVEVPGHLWNARTLKPKTSTLNHQRYSGMAPDADLCLVCNATGDDADLIPDSLLYLYTTATDILGFKYIFDYADKVGKPCVISFSEGSHDELYESGLYSEVLNKMLGPGHILCASAGNEGISDGTYMHKAEGETPKGAFLAKWAYNTATYVLRSKKPLQMRLSFYKDNDKAFDRNYDLTSLTEFPDSMMEDTVIVGTDTLLVDLETYPSCYDEKQWATDFSLTNLHNNNCGYAVPTAMTLLGEDNDIEAFGAGGFFIKNSSLDPTLDDFENTHNILFPGSSKDVVCVGATSYATSWTNVYGNPVGVNYGTDGMRARYSSIGPALNGMTKPEVMAPGTNIISAYNSFWRENNPTASAKNDILHTTYNGRTYPWGTSTGTSMATPVVAGIVALWLQVCPTLTPEQVKDVIAHTATHYVDSTDPTTEYPNNYYGWGQIDAMAGVEYIQQEYTGIEEISGSMAQVPGADAIYTLDGRRIQSIQGQRGVFIVGGKKVIR